jgi:hypothetical protein
VRRDEVVPNISALDSEYIELVAQAKEYSDSSSFNKLGCLAKKSDFDIIKSIDQVQRLRRSTTIMDDGSLRVINEQTAKLDSLSFQEGRRIE